MKVCLFFFTLSSVLFGITEYCPPKIPPSFCPYIPCCDVAISTGYIWKRDRLFQEAYGRGIQDVITVDGCCRIWRFLGMGVKSGYWKAQGKAAVCHKEISEIPILCYLRGKIGCTFQAYVSLGGGLIFVEEKSCLGHAKEYPWGGEVEAGLKYYFFRSCYLTTALRYLFFPTSKEKGDFGGYGIRAGIGISF